MRGPVGSKQTRGGAFAPGNLCYGSPATTAIRQILVKRVLTEGEHRFLVVSARVDGLGSDRGQYHNQGNKTGSDSIQVGT